MRLQTQKKSEKEILKHYKHAANLQLITGCVPLPGDCGELLFQCLDVGELDSLSSSSGLNHLTLKMRNKNEGVVNFN